MTKVRVAGFSISLDGFGAGPDQSLENPLGRRGLELHQWFFGTRTFRAMTGEGGGSEGIDEAYAHRSMDGFGAFILGRNMFGPIRGPWPDESWKGWWGANPPYHAPTFVLTHHQRDPIEMEGGTTFIFVTEGIEAALDQAKGASPEGLVQALSKELVALEEQSCFFAQLSMRWGCERESQTCSCARTCSMQAR
jgi:dihydrofolate reductase